MRTFFAMLIMLCLTTSLGCQSPRGGGMSGGEGFKITVPPLGTEVKQGDRQTVTVSLDRGDHFKRDVRLDVRASDGISVDPTSVLVKASDTPEVQLRISAAKEAAIGEYRIYVKGSPETGEATSTDFKVKVVAP